MRKLSSLLLIAITSLAPLHAAEMDEDHLKMEVCSILPSLEGWCSLEKALNFIDLVLQEKPKVYVEIGVFAGASLYPVLSTLKFLDHGVAIAIDPWDKYECIKYLDQKLDHLHIDWWGRIDLESNYASFLKTLRMFNLTDYCIPLRTSAEHAAKIIGVIDILHIDGNHSERSFTKYVQLYLPKVRSGGYIWLNDSLWIESQQAMDLLLEQCDSVKMIDSGNCMLFRKR
jgi:hypothetical protein